MRTRDLGNTGLRVSEIGLGAWQFGEPGWGGPDEAGARRIVDEALGLGCTFVDTAPAYAQGRSEQFLGAALEARRDRVVLCTKFGHWADSATRGPDYAADRIEESIELSLRRLRTDRLDVLLMHSPPEELIDPNASQFVVLERLRASGVIGAYGVSTPSNDSPELVRRIIDTGSQVAEIRFNPLFVEPRPAFEDARRAGLGLIVKVPLESGWLSGRYDETSTFDRVRSRWTRAQIEERARLVRELRALLPEGTDLVRASLAYILAHPAISTVIPGTKSVAQLRQNVAAADEPLPPEVVAAIDAWSEKLEPLAW